MNIEKPTIVLFDMDGTTVRHINPRLLGVLEKIDDGMFKAASWFHRKKPHPDFSPDLKKKPRLLVHRALHKMRRKEVDQIVQPCPQRLVQGAIEEPRKFPPRLVRPARGTGSPDFRGSEHEFEDAQDSTEGPALLGGRHRDGRDRLPRMSRHDELVHHVLDPVVVGGRDG